MPGKWYAHPCSHCHPITILPILGECTLIGGSDYALSLRFFEARAGKTRGTEFPSSKTYHLLIRIIRIKAPVNLL